MSPDHAISRQILAFHTAIIDDCDRAARPDRTDAMVLSLRNNAAVLARLQLEMLALTKPPAAELPEATHLGEAREPEPCAAAPDPDLCLPLEHAPHAAPEPEAHSLAEADRVLSGDALSRFVSRRLEPDESPHDVWQQLNDDNERSAKRRRTPALPRKAFRSPAT